MQYTGEDFLKEMAVNLLIFDKLPIPEYTIYDDPDYTEACRELDELMRQIEKEFPKDECDTVKNLISLRIVTEGFLRFDCFRTGLRIGAELNEEE